MTRAPEIDDALRALRRLLAGEPFAHDHRDRLFERRLGALADFAEARVLEAILQHGVEILRDAFHAPGADRLDAGLFDGLEDGARLRRLRQQPAMDVGVMAGEPQRHRIGMAAQDRRILAGRACAAARAGARAPRHVAPARFGFSAA